MAFRDPGIPDFTALPTGFYNVSRAVGRNMPNRSGDVMLVQLLLKKYYAKIGSVVQGILPPPGKMVVDGLFGPTTSRWVNEFQMRQNPKFPRSIAQDGVVDRAKDPWFGSISQTTYTILALNHRVRQLEPDLFPKLQFDPECPSALGGELLFNGPE